MNEDDLRQENVPQLPGAARFTRGTFVGCVGLLCILLTVPLLWIAVGAGSPLWSHSLALAAFATAVGGAALTLRVPSSLTQRSRDPLRPLTPAGFSPSVERPATPANRRSAVLAIVLTLGALLGVAFELVTPGKPLGLGMMLTAGAMLLTFGVLVTTERAPEPAWNWVRRTIYGSTLRASGPLIAGGLISLCGALFLALLDGFAWGLAGLALVVVVVVALTPLARRAQPQRGPAPTKNRRTP